MNKTELVYIKGGDPIQFQTDTFKPNVPYRCIEITEGGDIQYMVYGIIFDEDTFKKTFDYVYDRVMFHFESMELIKDGKPISKTAFGKILSIHTYGRRGRVKKHIGFIHNSIGCIYGFYPIFNDTKKEFLNTAYILFYEMVKGDMQFFDSGRIQFGNCGIPLWYGNLVAW